MNLTYLYTWVPTTSYFYYYLPTYLLLLLNMLSYTYSKKTIAIAFFGFSPTRLFITYL